MSNFFYFGPPREGKTYLVVQRAKDKLDANKNVLTNQPVRTKQGKFSRVWKKSYVSKNIQNSLVIIDEAQVDYDSVEVKTLDQATDDFFAFSGQNCNEVIVVSQGPTRVTKALRDRMNYWVKVEKCLDLFFIRNREGKFGYPLLFRSLTWNSFEDMQSGDRKKALVQYHLFRRSVAECYNTHFFANTGEIFTPPTWREELIALGRNPDECTQDKSGPSGQKSISANKNGRKLAQRPEDPVSHPDVPGPQNPKGSKTGIKNLLEKIAQKIRCRIFPGTYQGGERVGSSPGNNGGLSPNKRDPPDMDRPDRGDTGEPSTGPEVQSVLPGDDQANEPGKI